MGKWRYIVTVCAAMVVSVSLAACADKEENSGINALEPVEMVAGYQDGETDAVLPKTTEAQDVNQQADQRQTQNVSVPSTTIVGSIQSLGDGSFSISRADIDGNVMVIADEIVNVAYSDSTEFEVCTSTDGGITASYAAGTSTDLQTGRIVHIDGAYEGQDFVAQKITIMIFG